MNKVIITMIIVVVIISAIVTAFAILDDKAEESAQQESNINVNVGEEKILDDCTEEYELLQENTVKTNSENVKTSPNCSLIIKTYFKGCEHTTNRYDNLPENMVNLTEAEIQEKYPDYEIQNFTTNEVILFQERNGECGEHYLIKGDGGMVTIYRILENGDLEEQEATQISTEYLPETDKINIENGIRINGKQELNELIEDFE